MAQWWSVLAHSIIVRTGSQHPYYRWIIPVSNCKPRSGGVRQEAPCGTLASNPDENKPQVQGETTTKRKRGKVTEGDTWHLLLASVCKCTCVHMCTLKIKIYMARNYRFWVGQLIDFPEIHTEAFLSGECQSCLQERKILFSHGA